MRANLERCSCGCGKAPSDCQTAVELGAALADYALQPRFNEALAKAWRAFGRRSDLRRALQARDPDAEECLFWFIDSVQVAGMTPLEHFASEKSGAFSDSERRHLAILRSLRLRILEVESIKDPFLKLRDLLDGSLLTVQDSASSARANKWDILAGWVALHPEGPRFWGRLRAFPQHCKVGVLAAARFPSKGVKADFPESGFPELRALHAAAQDVEPEESETLHSCRARYEVGPGARLALNRALHPLEPGLWALPGIGGVDRTSFRLEGGVLTLETITRGRLEEARELVESIRGCRARFLGEEVLPLEPGARATPEAAACMEARYALAAAARWAAQPSHRLGRRAPKDAAGSTAGRAEIEQMAKELENEFERTGDPTLTVPYIATMLTLLGRPLPFGVKEILAMMTLISQDDARPES